MSEISLVNGEDNADISSVSQGGKAKTSIGKSGVEFRYYKAPEYNLLSSEQKSELKDYRDNKQGTPGCQGTSKKPRNNSRDDTKQKKWIASAVEKQLAQKNGGQDDDSTETDFKSYIMSLISESKKPPLLPPPLPQLPSPDPRRSPYNLFFGRLRPSTPDMPRRLHPLEGGLHQSRMKTDAGTQDDSQTSTHHG